MTPQLVLLAGPNGAGKSTFYDVFLAESELPFLNADLLAAETGIESFDAARILDAMREEMIAQRRGFITETVFSDPHGVKLDMLRRAVAAGFDVTLIYVGLASPELAERRIDQRIARGGHVVPRYKIASRYERSLANLKTAIDALPAVKIYDNSLVAHPYRLVATFANGQRTYRMPGALPAWTKQLPLKLA